MGFGEFNAGGNPAMDKHPIQGGVEILPVATEIGISSGLMGHLARMQTLPFYFTVIINCLYFGAVSILLELTSEWKLSCQRHHPVSKNEESQLM